MGLFGRKAGRAEARPVLSRAAGAGREPGRRRAGDRAGGDAAAAARQALQRLDLLTQARVMAVGVNTPPGAPGEGQAWVVGAAPTGDWAGRGGALAGWTAGGWRFVTPVEGMSVWSVADGCPATWTTGGWQTGLLTGQRVTIGGVQVVGARAPAVGAPAGGAVVDAEARGVLGSVLAALRHHGLIAT